MTREPIACADPGCPSPCARGAYCAEHAALFYRPPKVVSSRSVEALAGWVERADWSTPLGPVGRSEVECEGAKAQIRERQQRRVYT